MRVTVLTDARCPYCGYKLDLCSCLLEEYLEHEAGLEDWQISMIIENFDKMNRTCFNCACLCEGYWGHACELDGGKIPESKTCDAWYPNYEEEVKLLREENMNLELKLKRLEWVPMSERLPNHDEDIIVYGIDESGTGYMSFLEYNKDNHDECGGITHWMLIPETPPKDGDNNG